MVLGRRIPTALVALGAVLFSSTAAAGDCKAPYTLDLLLGDLANVESALRTGDDANAGAGSSKLQAGLGCLNEVIPVMIVGRTYRAIGSGQIAAGETQRGLEWFRTATEMEQSFDYGIEDLPADHPVRGYYADAKIQASGEVVVMEDMSFIDGNHWVDGRKYKVPQARLDRPHLYQLEGGGQVLSWIITGNGYPPDVLKAGAVEPKVATNTGAATIVGNGKPPKAGKEPKPSKTKPEKVAKEGSPEKKPKPVKQNASTNSDGTVVVQRQRPWEKTPLMIGGGAVIAGAGGIYVAATRSRKAFDEGTTLEDIQKLQATTNQLVIISAATLGVGAGVLTWGVILDGSGAPLPAVNFRF